MKLFSKVKIGGHTVYRIFGVKVSLKRIVPSKLDLPKRIKEVEALFRKKMKYELNLDNPQTFNEKINWYK